MFCWSRYCKLQFRPLWKRKNVILSTVFLPTTSLVFSTLWKNLLMQRRWMRLEKLPKVFLFLRLILESFGSEQKEKRRRLNSDLGKSNNLNFCERNIFFPNIQNWLWTIFITKMKEHVNDLIIIVILC